MRRWGLLLLGFIFALPLGAQESFRQLEELSRQNKCPELIPRSESWLRQNPDHPFRHDVRMMRARCYLGGQDFGRAQQELLQVEKELGTQGFRARGFSLLSEVYIRSKSWHRLLELAEKYAISAEDPEPWRLKAMAYRQMGKPREAAKAYEVYRQVSGQGYAFAYELAKLHEQAGDPTAALAEYGKAFLEGGQPPAAIRQQVLQLCRARGLCEAALQIYVKLLREGFVHRELFLLTLELSSQAGQLGSFVEASADLPASREFIFSWFAQGMEVLGTEDQCTIFTSLIAGGEDAFPPTYWRTCAAPDPQAFCREVLRQEGASLFARGLCLLYDGEAQAATEALTAFARQAYRRQEATEALELLEVVRGRIEPEAFHRALLKAHALRQMGAGAQAWALLSSWKTQALSDESLVWLAEFSLSYDPELALRLARRASRGQPDPLVTPRALYVEGKAAFTLGLQQDYYKALQKLSVAFAKSIYVERLGSVPQQEGGEK